MVRSFASLPSTVVVTRMTGPRFDVIENGRTIRDDDGMDLLSLEAARLEAARTAAEMLRDRTQEKAEPADIRLVVRDGQP